MNECKMPQNFKTILKRSNKDLIQLNDLNCHYFALLTCISNETHTHHHDICGQNAYHQALMSWAMQTNALSLPNTDSYVEAGRLALEERAGTPTGRQNRSW